jgi:hypothetical protein
VRGLVHTTKEAEEAHGRLKNQRSHGVGQLKSKGSG